MSINIKKYTKDQMAKMVGSPGEQAAGVVSKEPVCGAQSPD